MPELERLPDAHAGEGERASPRNTRYGLVLFAVYLLLYGGFMLLNVFAPAVMAVVLLAGVNVAVLYGIGLIVAALVLALVYGWLCRTPAQGGEEGR
jgi:uncharacterized membrane protein (DUF485 family)